MHAESFSLEEIKSALPKWDFTFRLNGVACPTQPPTGGQLAQLELLYEGDAADVLRWRWACSPRTSGSWRRSWT